MTEEILAAYEPEVEALEIIPSDGGRFEIEVDGELVYSKLETRRHIEAGEAVLLIRQHMKAR